MKSAPGMHAEDVNLPFWLINRCLKLTIEVDFVSIVQKLF